MSFWRNRRVFVTGHTGFKGGWLSLWLSQKGAQVRGYALLPPTVPSFFEDCSVSSTVESEIADIRDLERLRAALSAHSPEVVFHLAAQPLVRRSYDDPIGTYTTNVVGTANLLEAVRGTNSVRAVVVVTTDKCYENKEWLWGYREIDALGGFDPYSSSKACAEMVTACYRNSFFSPERYSDHGVAIASVRAGNVIGGGDWAEDRLIPDVMRAFSAGESVRLRNPHAVRPWQHVLEPLRGYLMVAERLVQSGPTFGEAWNFGPSEADEHSVRDVVAKLAAGWGDSRTFEIDAATHPHETQRLRLDWSKAASKLQWRPALGLDGALAMTVDWYKKQSFGENMRSYSISQIDHYSELIEGGRQAAEASVGSHS